MPGREKLAAFNAWCAKHISGDEKGEAQFFLELNFHAFVRTGRLDSGVRNE